VSLCWATVVMLRCLTATTFQTYFSVIAVTNSSGLCRTSSRLGETPTDLLADSMDEGIVPEALGFAVVLKGANNVFARLSKCDRFRFVMLIGILKTNVAHKQRSQAVLEYITNVQLPRRETLITLVIEKWHHFTLRNSDRSVVTHQVHLT
jgi:hypothetical protein